MWVYYNISLLQVHMIYLHMIAENKILFWLQLLLIVPLVLCVVVGYKTRLAAVIVAAWLLLVSLISYPFYLHLAHGRTWG